MRAVVRESPNRPQQELTSQLLRLPPVRRLRWCLPESVTADLCGGMAQLERRVRHLDQACDLFDAQFVAVLHTCQFSDQELEQLGNLLRHAQRCLDQLCLDLAPILSKMFENLNEESSWTEVLEISNLAYITKGTDELRSDLAHIEDLIIDDTEDDDDGNDIEMVPVRRLAPLTREMQAEARVFIEQQIRAWSAPSPISAMSFQHPFVQTCESFIQHLRQDLESRETTTTAMVTATQEYHLHLFEAFVLRNPKARQVLAMWDQTFVRVLQEVDLRQGIETVNEILEATLHAGQDHLAVLASGGTSTLTTNHIYDAQLSMALETMVCDDAYIACDESIQSEGLKTLTLAVLAALKMQDPSQVHAYLETRRIDVASMTQLAFNLKTAASHVHREEHGPGELQSDAAITHYIAGFSSLGASLFPLSDTCPRLVDEASLPGLEKFVRRVIQMRTPDLRAAVLALTVKTQVE